MAKRILLAEDEPSVTRLIQVNLELAGYTLDCVADGEAALAAIRDALPDLLILDVTMPRLDGFEVLRALKSDPETAQLPVVMLTGKSDDESVFKAWQSGVDCYMTKPFDPAELATMVQRLLSEDERWDG